MSASGREADVHCGRVSPFHAALVGVGVSAVFRDYAEALHREFTRLVLDDFLQIKVPDGKMIMIELERSGNRFEVGLPQRIPYRIFVAQISLRCDDALLMSIAAS